MTNMQFKTGQTVVRHDPGDHQTTFSIQNEQDVKYHAELSGRGYQYTDITKVAEVDFDLPAVDAPRLTIHRKSIDDECASCSA